MSTRKDEIKALVHRTVGRRLASPAQGGGELAQLKNHAETERELAVHEDARLGVYIAEAKRLQTMHAVQAIGQMQQNTMDVFTSTASQITEAANSITPELQPELAQEVQGFAAGFKEVAAQDLVDVYQAGVGVVKQEVGRSLRPAPQAPPPPRRRGVFGWLFGD